MGEKIKQPDNRWQHYKGEKPKTDVEKAQDLAEKLLGRQKVNGTNMERWSVVRGWHRGMFEIAIQFETGYGHEVFVYEPPTQGEDKVLHRVNFEPPHDPDGKIASISARDLRSKDDLLKDDLLFRPAQ
jgi:hypothetical protein